MSGYALWANPTYKLSNPFAGVVPQWLGRDKPYRSFGWVGRRPVFEVTVCDLKAVNSSAES